MRLSLPIVGRKTIEVLESRQRVLVRAVTLIVVVVVVGRARGYGSSLTPSDVALFTEYSITVVPVLPKLS